MGALRWTIPPMYDNEMAVNCLTNEIGKDGKIEWVVVRPDDLLDKEESEYEILESPSWGLTNGKETTRANVARFMVDLVENDQLWTSWLFRMPVIINKQQN